jgi:hypothetical protein
MYILIAIIIAIPFWILFNFLDQLVFFEPIWSFYLPEDAITGFSDYTDFDFYGNFS